MILADRGDGVRLAIEAAPGPRAPAVVFLPGFMSDMTGDKATAIAALCAATGHPCLRFDYSGHGASEGRFEDGTIGVWLADALFAIGHLAPGPLVLVGSSMGGWIALLAACRLGARAAGLIGIAAAPDFTETLPEAARQTALREGAFRVPSRYGGEQVLTRALIEDGARHALLGAPIPIACPVRLLHGQQDEDVPWQTALRIAERLASPDVEILLVKDAGHRLSRPADLARLRHALAALLGEDGA